MTWDNFLIITFDDDTYLKIPRSKLKNKDDGFFLNRWFPIYNSTYVYPECVSNAMKTPFENLILNYVEKSKLSHIAAVNFGWYLAD